MVNKASERSDQSLSKKNRNTTYILFNLIPVVLLCTGAAIAQVNIEGSRGTGRVFSAQCLEAGFLSINVNGDFSKFKYFDSSEPDALLMCQDLSLTYGISEYFEVFMHTSLYEDVLDKKSNFGTGDTRLALKILYPPYPHSKGFGLAFLPFLTGPTGTLNKGFYKRSMYYDEAFTSEEFDLGYWLQWTTDTRPANCLSACTLTWVKLLQARPRSKTFIMQASLWNCL
jgi:hypothetical protein